MNGKHWATTGSNHSKCRGKTASAWGSLSVIIIFSFEVKLLEIFCARAGQPMVPLSKQHPMMYSAKMGNCQKVGVGVFHYRIQAVSYNMEQV